MRKDLALPATVLLVVDDDPAVRIEKPLLGNGLFDAIARALTAKAASACGAR
jgi:hypothetical protein